MFSTGQLLAENSTFIEVPKELSSRNINIFEIQITELVEEGTVVQQGDFVASLDHSTVEELLTNAEENLKKALQSLEDARIDTNINMSNLRDGLLNAKVEVEEKSLCLSSRCMSRLPLNVRQLLILKGQSRTSCSCKETMS